MRAAFAVGPHPGPLPKGEGELERGADKIGPHPGPRPQGEGEKRYALYYIGGQVSYVATFEHTVSRRYG